ncbi:MAG: hypothetical protein ACM37Z_20875 [Deltaproteobacteria bacterium]
MAVPKLKRQFLMLALKQQEVSKIITIGRGTAVAKKFQQEVLRMGGDTPPGESSNTAIQCRRLSAAHC